MFGNSHRYSEVYWSVCQEPTEFLGMMIMPRTERDWRWANINKIVTFIKINNFSLTSLLSTLQFNKITNNLGGEISCLSSSPGNTSLENSKIIHLVIETRNGFGRGAFWSPFSISLLTFNLFSIFAKWFC